MTVTELWRYPVKSMAGERLEAVDVGPNGFAGDRAFAVRDEVRGGIRGAKQLGGLMQLAARRVSEPSPTSPGVAEIVAPDGSCWTTADADAGARISAAIDHEVTLWPLRPADDLDHYRRGPLASDDLLGELREMFAREPDEPLPDLSRLPPEILEFESPPGTYFDAYPLLVLTQQSLDSLARCAPQSVVDVRRFRPNLLLDAPGVDAPFPEAGWEGRRLRVGDVELDLTVACPRCVMVTREQGDIPRDRSLMRTLVREAGGNLGVYATVARPGRITVGDPVELM